MACGGDVSELMAIHTETCWACGQTESYNTEKLHRPFNWHTKTIAGAAHMLCSGCCALLNIQGRLADALIQQIESRHGLKLDEKGNLLP